MSTRLEAISDWVADYGKTMGFGAWADETLAGWIGKLDVYGTTVNELTAVSDLMRQSPMDPGESKSLSSHWPWIMQALNSVRAHNRAEKDAAEAQDAGNRNRQRAGCEHGCSHGFVIVPHPDAICLINRTWKQARTYYTCVATCHCQKGQHVALIQAARKHPTLEQVERTLGPDWREMMAQRDVLLQQRWIAEAVKDKRPAERMGSLVPMGGVFEDYLKKHKNRSSR